MCRNWRLHFYNTCSGNCLRPFNVLKFNIWDGAPWRWRRRTSKRVGVLVQQRYLVCERWRIERWFNEVKINIIEDCSKKYILFDFVIGPLTAVGSHEWSKLFPSMELKHNIGKYMIINAVVFILYYLVLFSISNWRQNNIVIKGIKVLITICILPSKTQYIYIYISTHWWNISYIRATCFGRKTAISRPMQNTYKEQYKRALYGISYRLQQSLK